MKKFFAAFVCAAVLLSVLIVPSFAAETYPLYVYTGGTPSISFQFGEYGSSLTTYSAVSSGPTEIRCLPSVVYVLVASGGYFTTGNQDPISTDFEHPSVLADSLGVSFHSDPTFDDSHFFIILGNLSNSVNTGFSSSIGFVGDVINFLTSNSTTIFAIGLSVAMLCVLPWGIRKLKGLIKGY